MLDSVLSPGAQKALVMLPHFLVVVPTVLQCLQYIQLATKSRRAWQPPALLAILSALELGLIFEWTMNPPFFGGEHAPLPATNWGVSLHNAFTGLQFTAYMLISAWLGGKELWMFVGLTSYQASQVYQLYKRAYAGIEQYIVRGVPNPAYNAAAPLEGVPQWLGSEETPLHNAPITSFLDNSELGKAFVYFKQHWHTTVVADAALMVATVLLLASLKNSLNTSADRSSKLTMAFLLAFLATAAMNSIPLASKFLAQWPASLTLPYITPAATPFLYSYARPRIALLSLALGVLVRSMIIGHIAFGGDAVAPTVAPGAQVQKKKKW